jgi:hypothetical protein
MPAAEAGDDKKSERHLPLQPSFKWSKELAEHQTHPDADPESSKLTGQVRKPHDSDCKAQASSAVPVIFLSETAVCPTSRPPSSRLAKRALLVLVRPVIKERTPLSRSTSVLPQFFKGDLFL